MLEGKAVMLCVGQLCSSRILSAGSVPTCFFLQKTIAIVTAEAVVVN